jgi:hypothetical protein
MGHVTPVDGSVGISTDRNSYGFTERRQNPYFFLVFPTDCSTDVPVRYKFSVYRGVAFVQKLLHFTQDLVDS